MSESGFFSVDGLPLGPLGVSRVSPTGDDYVTVAGSTLKYQCEAAVPDAYCETPEAALAATRAGVERYIRWKAAQYQRPCIYWRSAPAPVRLDDGRWIAPARLTVGEALA